MFLTGLYSGSVGIMNTELTFKYSSFVILRSSLLTLVTFVDRNP